MTSVVNWAIEQHIPSRGRALRVQGLHVSCVGGGVTLIQDPNIPSLEGIYLDHCAKSHEDPTLLSSTSLKYILNEDMHAESLGDLSLQDRKARVYSEACKAIPSTVLRDRFTQSCRSLSESYSARREYASQLGLNAAMQYLLSAPAASAEQLLLCCKSGTMMHIGATPQYRDNTLDGKTELQRNLDLPFRMTRNVVGALSGTFVLGATTLSLGLSMDACLASSDVLETSLSLLIGADLRARRKSSGRSASSDVTVIKVTLHPSVDVPMSASLLPQGMTSIQQYSPQLILLTAPLLFSSFVCMHAQAMSAMLLNDIESRAPITMIKTIEADGIGLESSPQKFKGPSPPVDIHVQELIKLSMSDDNIIKLDDLAWLPWM